MVLWLGKVRQSDLGDEVLKLANEAYHKHWGEKIKTAIPKELKLISTAA